MTTNDEVRDLEWTTEKPSRPGAYYVRGFNWGRNDKQYEALVQVASHWFLGDEAPSLVCNLHVSTSEDDLSNWSELKDINEKFEWAGPFLTASTIQQLQVEVERLREDAERYRWLRDHALWSQAHEFPEPLQSLLQFTEHCISASDEGVDFHVPRAWLDAMTTLGLLEKAGRARWSVTDKADAFVSALKASPVQDAEAIARYAYDHAGWDWEAVRIGVGERFASPVQAEAVALRYFANGPEGLFITDNAAFAEKLIGLFDPDDWTVTDLHAALSSHRQAGHELPAGSELPELLPCPFCGESCSRGCLFAYR